MKRKILYIFIGLVICLGLTGVALAAPDVTSLTEKVAGKAGYQTAGVTDTTLSKTVGGIIRYALGFIGVLFLVLTVYAGFLWMTAAGNEDSVSKAKKILSSSVIGLVIVASAYGITALVLSIILKTAAPDSTYTGGSESVTQRKMGCCWIEGTTQCWEFASVDQCTGRWFSDQDCGTVDLPGSATCVQQN